MSRSAEEFEPQFAPGMGSAKVRREIDRINRIVARMLRAGIPMRDINFLVKAYDRQGERYGRLVELSEHQFEAYKAKQHAVN
jgi:hypothetical protein